jgi:hypothetical protein
VRRGNGNIHRVCDLDMLANNPLLSCYPAQEQMEAIRQMREGRAEQAPVRPKPAAALGIGPINIRCAHVASREHSDVPPLASSLLLFAPETATS